VHGYLRSDNIYVNSGSGEIKIGGPLIDKLADIMEGKMAFPTRQEDIRRFGLIAIEIGFMQKVKANRLSEIMRNLYQSSHISKEYYSQLIEDKLYCSLIERCLNADANTTAADILKDEFFATPRLNEETLGVTQRKSGKYQPKLARKQSEGKCIEITIQIKCANCMKFFQFKCNPDEETPDMIVSEMEKEFRLSQSCLTAIKKELEQKCQSFTLTKK
jgi:hypothetical protein